MNKERAIYSFVTNITCVKNFVYYEFKKLYYHTSFKNKKVNIFKRG